MLKPEGFFVKFGAGIGLPALPKVPTMGVAMDNRDTYESEGKGPSVGLGGGSGEGGESAVSQTGTPTTMDQNFEEERQKRQENWSPAGQTGFDTEDVDRQREIYKDDPPSDPEEGIRNSVNE